MSARGPVKAGKTRDLATVATPLAEGFLAEVGPPLPSSARELAELFGFVACVSRPASAGLADATWVTRPDVLDTDEPAELFIVVDGASDFAIACAIADRILHHAERRPCPDYPHPFGRQLELDETRTFSCVGRFFTREEWSALRDRTAEAIVQRLARPSRRAVAR